MARRVTRAERPGECPGATTRPARSGPTAVASDRYLASRRTSMDGTVARRDASPGAPAGLDGRRARAARRRVSPRSAEGERKIVFITLDRPGGRARRPISGRARRFNQIAARFSPGAGASSLARPPRPRPDEQPEALGQRAKHLLHAVDEPRRWTSSPRRTTWKAAPCSAAARSGGGGLPARPPAPLRAAPEQGAAFHVRRRGLLVHRLGSSAAGRDCFARCPHASASALVVVRPPLRRTPKSRSLGNEQFPRAPRHASRAAESPIVLQRLAG